MYRLLPAFFLLGFATQLFSQNPHGAALKLDCASCHSPAGWAIAADHWKGIELQKPTKSKTTGLPLPIDTTKFHHNKTQFPLTGRHASVDCRDCHDKLVFENTKTDCNSCHLDIHQQTVGNDCARCHSTNHWLVDDIQQIHFNNGFPLTGVHRMVSCEECHTSETALRFDRIGNLCVDCHLGDFNATTNPNHPQAGFSTDCLECHDLNTPGWGTDKVDHSFFPLTKGHELNDCAACHTGGNFTNTPNQCAACHQPDFDAAQNPNHVQAGFPNDCAQCHTTDLDWMPAQYLAHDAQHFPIYSGSHQGVWNACTECHTDPNNYAVNSCTTCHINPETNDGHTGVAGYVYENSACLACHPTGEADGAFDHNSTNFPLTGAHVTADCIECHANGYAGTPTDCASCHTTDFNQTTNPNHTSLGLSNDCASCHTTDPGWAPATFANHNDFYVLQGAHATIANDCAACHNGDYNNTPNTCIGCHTSDFNAVADPNHVANQFPDDCTTCHSETAWVPSTFDHNGVWPITGAHLPIANDCAECHIGGNYMTTPTDCAGCHTPDFTGATNPNHVVLNLPNDCALCHTIVPDWQPAAFPLHNDFYVLNGAHATIANDCAACHNGNYNNTPNTCIGCHQADFNATTSPSHVALQFSTDCTTCHSETTWSPATFDHDAQYFPIYSGAHNGEWNACMDCHTNPANWAEFTCTTCHANPETNNQHNGVGGYVYQSNACLACHPTGDADNIFDHNTTAFPLTGAHLSADCLECHSAGFQNTPTDCASCHTTDFNGSMNPNHVMLNLPMDCAQCHSTQPDWAPASFGIHNQFYPLNGAHATIANDCATCHNGNYNNTPNTCIGCHTPDFNAAADPNHVANQFPQDCATCHSETAWAPSTFNHNSVWPFTGAHIAVANECAQCHVGGNYTTTPTDCAGCHTPDFAQSANPNHTALGLPTDCAICHTTAPDWQPAAFPIHNDFYVLNGAHAMIANDCAACHNGNYNNTPNTCFACHAADYNGTTNPNHQSAQFPTDCANCHGESAWVPANFNHDAQYFPIYSGAHNGEWNACVDCHSNPANFAEVNCTGCHTNPETNNQHNGVGGYSYSSPACLACHPTGDALNIFDHNATSFPLTGAHLNTDCVDCHAGGNFQSLSMDCASCHSTDFNGSANPNHVALGLSNDCASCHTTAPGWAPASFAVHNQFYPLNGAHAAVANQCAECHNGNYNNTPNTCIGCHASDLNGTSDPDHEANQFPTDCATCHSESAWIPSTFNHNSVWPLTGAHLPIANDCAECHVGGNYSNTPTTCAGCHTPNFNQSQNPNHVALGLPNDCAMCHTTAPDWQPATFPIHNQFYQLNGAHATIANQCAECHNGNYTNTPNTCYACHTADFNGTTNPNHQQAGFSHDCATCHSETAWVPANFDHDAQYFPIYSGTHDGEWDNCTDCHTNPNNFAVFTCTTCHANPETNNQHNGVNGYSYSSPACLACHPNGEGDGFNHNTIWPLTGAHATADCVDCHANGYQGTPTDCAACHTTDYNASANPDHEVLNFPTDCASCHTTAPGWAPATFAIHNQFYPLTGAHSPIANDCAACHNGNYNNTPNTCAGCHTPDYNASANPDHQVLALPNDCAMCHTTAPDWQPASFPIHNQFYQLNGAHATIANDCAACHNGNYNNTPTTCVGCHLPDYNATTNPDHEAAQFPTTCNDCHSETAWAPATFDHNAVWPLTGAHQAIANQCTECHVGGNYNNTPNTCVGCHQPDYNTSTNPNHGSLGIPTTCDQCHTTVPDWQPATFPIHDQYYVLAGAHVAIANQCAECHNGNYNNTPNTCVGCHQPDYNGATDPNHATNQFPTACLDCHSQSAWTPSTFDHNAIWPMTGAHIPIANQCTECHIGGNYNNTPNTCVGCHQPDYNGSTNPNHSAIAIPTDCAMCHTTDPDWNPATFPIHSQYWPLNGAHATIANQCAECHNGNYNNTPTTCVGCHLADYNGANDPNHQQAGFPTTCQNCHTETAWTPSTWDHDNQYFPIFSGRHDGEWNQCVECHTTAGNFSQFSCIDCHEHDDPVDLADKHQGVSGYQYVSSACYSCHPDGED